jgi:hypothetical protein
MVGLPAAVDLCGEGALNAALGQGDAFEGDLATAKQR